MKRTILQVQLSQIRSSEPTVEWIVRAAAEMSTIKSYNHRLDEEQQRLLESIRELGVLNPVYLFRDGDDFYIADGVERIRACQKLGLVNIPAFVLEEERANDN